MLARFGLPIEAEALSLLDGLFESSSWGINNFQVEEDLVFALTWMSQGKREPWKLDHQIQRTIDPSRELGCCFTWKPRPAKETTKILPNKEPLY